MSHPVQPNVKLSDDYREKYANSVHLRASLYDFFLQFGIGSQTGPELTIENYLGIYVSPQQAKALTNLLVQNIQQYEAAFGEIRLEPQSGSTTGGIIQ